MKQQQTQANNSNNKISEPNITWLKIGSLLPISIHLGLIIFIYTMYLSTYIFPMITNTYNFTALIEISYTIEISQFIMTQSRSISGNQIKGIILFIIFHVLITIYLISAYKVVMTNPGGIPPEFNQQQLQNQKEILKQEQQFVNKVVEEVTKTQPPRKSTIRNLHQSILSQSDKDEKEDSFVEYKQTPQETGELLQEEQKKIEKLKEIHVNTMVNQSQQYRLCNKCKLFKPPRTHHCSICQCCVLKMDHQQKYFNYIYSCLWINNCIGFYNYKYFMVMLIYVSLLLLLVTITYIECYLDASSGRIGGVTLYFIAVNFILSLTLTIIVIGFTCFHFWLISQNKTTLEYCEKKRDGVVGKYDFGCTQNFEHVFNDNCWFCPINPNEKDKGLVFAEKINSQNNV